MDELRDGARAFAGLLRKAGHRPNERLLGLIAIVPLVHVRCAHCGKLAGTVEGHGPNRELRVLVGDARHDSLDAVVCADHGPLVVTWESLAAHIARARETHRPRTIRVRSTP
jgi:hypothetical protein